MADKNTPFSMEDLAALARSPAGQALFTALQSQDSSALNRAMNLAASGDMKAAGAALSPLLSDPKVREIVGKLGGR